MLVFWTWCILYGAGQYTGVSKPMPEYHTKISSFNETVSVLVMFDFVKQMAEMSSLSSVVKIIKSHLMVLESVATEAYSSH